MAAPDPTSVGRRGSKLGNAWRHRSSTQQGDEARGHGPCGNTGAHLSKEGRSGAMGHVATLKLTSATGHMAALKETSAGRCGLKL
jgi:hypothetical protein